MWNEAYGQSDVGKRLMIFHWPLGVPGGWGGGTFFTPTQTSLTNWTIAQNSFLKPLESHKADINIVSGLGYDQIHGTVGSHGHCAAAFTGSTAYSKGSSMPWVDTLSVDQIAAESFSPFTTIPSLNLLQYDSESEFSFKRDGMAAKHSEWINRPDTAFAQMFGLIGSSDAELIANERLMIVDLVLEDARQLSAKLGKADQDRVAAHLQSIFDLQRNIESARTSVCEAPVSPTAPGGFQGNPLSWFPYAQMRDYSRLMIDLSIKAMECDLSRVLFFSMGRSEHYRIFANLAPPINWTHHNLTHSGNGANPEMDLFNSGEIGAQQSYYQRASMFIAEEFSYFLDKIKAANLGDQSLWNSSAIVGMSEFGDGGLHLDHHLPVIAAGGLGGMLGGKNIQLRHDYGGGNPANSWKNNHYAATGNTLTNKQNLQVTCLWQTVLQALGIYQNGEKFGDPSLDTITIPGLWLG
jgi:hypothetical protein